MHEVGIIWKQAVLVSNARLGEASRLLVHSHVGSLVQGVNLDVLPLPVERALPDEGRILKALQGGASPEHISRDFPLSVRRAGRSAWNFLIVCLVNYLNLGLSAAESQKLPAGPASITDAHASSLEYLEEQVDYMLESCSAKVPEIDWEKIVAARQLDYTGELLLKGVPVTWRQIQPGLPPEGVAGRVAAVDLASEEMQPWLRRPELSAKPRSECPRRFRRSYVKVKPGELPGLVRGLYKHGDLFPRGQGSDPRQRGEPLGQWFVRRLQGGRDQPWL